jgi:acetyltransferase
MSTGCVLSLVVPLRDSTPVRIRLVRPDDHARLLRGVSEMSGTSRYLRFFTATRGMTADQARYFTEIDQINHVAVCAVEPTDAEERGYGIARFVRDADDPAAADFAIAVIDHLQGRGLGTILLAALHVLAHVRGICELQGEVLADNPVMPHWLQRLGATVQTADDAAYRRICWRVSTAGVSTLPDGASAFVRWMTRLQPVFGR